MRLEPIGSIRAARQVVFAVLAFAGLSALTGCGGSPAPTNPQPSASGNTNNQQKGQSAPAKKFSRTPK